MKIVSFIFICVYVPVNTLERMLFLDTLSNVLCNCNPDHSLLLGGGILNCTESLLDRNHVEPHMPSQKRLIQLLKTHEIVDVWRNFHGIQRQYTWAHAYDNLISLARLDRFYCFKHQLNLFRSVSICPVGLSDHSLLQCAVSRSFIKPKSAYWHFNSNLLCDKHFKDILKSFGFLSELQNLLFNVCSSGGMLQKHKLSSCVSNILSMSQETSPVQWKQLRKN